MVFAGKYNNNKNITMDMSMMPKHYTAKENKKVLDREEKGLKKIGKHSKGEAIKRKMEGLKTSIGKVLRLHKGKE